MLNHIIIQGRFASDPELKKTPSGTDVLTFTIACQREDKTKGADFISCVAWNSAAQTIAQYFNKGDEILIEGRLQLRDYTDKNGQKRYVAEVVTQHWNFTTGRKSAGGEALPVDAEGELPF